MECLGHPSVSHPQTKTHCWSVRSSVRKGHFCDRMSMPWDLKRQGTGGPDGHQRPIPWQHRDSALQPQVCLEAPPAQRSEQRGRHCFPQVMADGGENRLSSAPESRHHCPLHRAVPTAAPCHQGSLTMLPLQLGVNWGRWARSPESSALWLYQPPSP